MRFEELIILGLRGRMISHRLPEGLYLFVLVMMISHWLPKGAIPIHADLTRFVLINPRTSLFDFFCISVLLFVLRIALLVL